MAKLTLLDIVNTYMDMTDGFRVSDIDDVLESQQIASIAEKVFNDVVNDTFHGELSSDLIQLEALADTSKPNYLKVPDSVISIPETTILYNTTSGDPSASTIKMTPMVYRRPQDFLQEVGARSSNLSNSQLVTDFNGYQFVIQNKKAPVFFTSFDKSHLVFDSFDSDVDTTLQASKSGALVKKQRSWTQSSTYVIDLPEWYHQTFLNEVIAEASEALRGEPIFRASRKARLGKMRARKKQRFGNQGRTTRQRNYGR